LYICLPARLLVCQSFYKHFLLLINLFVPPSYCPSCSLRLRLSVFPYVQTSVPSVHFSILVGMLIQYTFAQSHHSSCLCVYLSFCLSVYSILSVSIPRSVYPPWSINGHPNVQPSNHVSVCLDKHTNKYR